MSDANWLEYIERFHAERPGITERILVRCRSAGIDPYQWCSDALAGCASPVLDIACGSARLRTRREHWVGADTSAAELTLASARGRGPLLRSSGTQLAIASGSVSGVVCTMAMQILQPPSAAIAEIARVLRPRGHAVLLMPATGPLTWRETFLYLRLEAALRQRIRYPNDRLLTHTRLTDLTSECRLSVTSDERRTFALRIDSAEDAAELVRSLYLPGVTVPRLQRAERLLRRRIGGTMAVPLRRVVLERQP